MGVRIDFTLFYSLYNHVLKVDIFNTIQSISGVARGGQGGAAAPGRRPEGGAKILPKNFFNLYTEKFLKI